MHLSAPFIRRPVATSLLSLALLLAGSVAYSLLPVASLPNVDFPVIGVGAGLPGASPETMASSVATPLERQFGRIAGVNQMTSSSSLGSASVTLQFDINRDIDAAARDVQAAINAARSQLPAYLPQNPSYRKANPAEAPILILTLTSDVVPKPQIYDMADSILAQKISQIQGVGQVFVGGSSSPAVRVELNPMQLGANGIGLEAVRTALAGANANRPKGAFQDANHRWQISDNDQIFKARDYAPIIAGYNQQTGAPVRISDLGTVVDSVADIHTARRLGHQPGQRASGAAQERRPDHHLQDSRRQRDLDRGQRDGRDAAPAGRHPAHHQDRRGRGPHHHHPLQRARRGDLAHDQRDCWWCWWSSSSCARCGPPSFPRWPCRFRWWAPSA